MKTSCSLLIALVTGLLVPWAWGAVCHDPVVVPKWYGTDTIDYTNKKEIEEASMTLRVLLSAGVTTNTDFPPNLVKVYHHPFGTTTTTSRSNTRGQPVIGMMPVDGGVWEDCCDCGENQQAGYQLLIYSQDQDPRTQLLDKPILVTQGFDLNYGIPGKQFNYVEFHDILNSVFDEENTPWGTKDEDKGKLADNGLLNDLYHEGYDIVLLLWKNSSISLETNARVTLQALRWISDHTEARPGAEPVVIGPSMGGLITRLALQQAGADFAHSGIRARLFIAFDSPNRGAEVPMSLQAALTYFSSEDNDAKGKWKNLTGPAARQLLLSPVKDFEKEATVQLIDSYEELNPGQGTLDHARFMELINNEALRDQIRNIVHDYAGFTAPIRTAAVVNGSGTGQAMDIASRGYLYAFWKKTTCLPFCIGFDMNLSLDHLKRAQGEHPEVFFADLAITPNGFSKDPMHYIFEEPAFMENVPGGSRNTYRVFVEGTDDSWKHDFYDSDVVNHAFIPTLSGIGLLNRPLDIDESWHRAILDTAERCAPPLPRPPPEPPFPPLVPGVSIFDQFCAPEKNQRHVAVTRENKQWFLTLIHSFGPQDRPQAVQSIAGVACVTDPDLPLSTLTATFGYNNPNTFEVRIPIGENNRFTGEGIQENEGQTETFLAGRQNGVFRVIFGGPSGRGIPQWNLDGLTVMPSIPGTPGPCRPFIGQ